MSLLKIKQRSLMETTQYNKSTLYTKEYIIETSCGNIEVKALTFKELDILYNKYKEMPHSLRVKLVEKSLLDINDFKYLTDKDIGIIYKIVTDVSSISTEDFNLVKDSLNMIKDDTFKDPSFKSCQLCQEKKLDKLRNCPLLDTNTHSPDVFYLVNNKKLTACPMDNINNNILVSDAIEAFLLYNDKVLPMTGGMFDQTTYFCKVAPMAKSILHQPSLEDMNN